MARTPSTMIPLGTPAPRFAIPDVVSGNVYDLSKQAERVATVIMFICNHCPFVKHINQGLKQLALDYQAKQIQFLAINSNDATQYPDDSPDNMKLLAKEQGFTFPYLYDESQDVARAYQAACTPDFFIYDHQLKLVYRGQLDDSRPGNDIPVDGISIRQALDCLLSNKPVPIAQKPSLGCNIKWKE